MVIHITEYYSIFKKYVLFFFFNSVICDNVDEPGGHSGKWSKSVTEGSSAWFLGEASHKIVTPIEMEYTWWYTRFVGRGKQEVAVQSVLSFNYAT